MNGLSDTVKRLAHFKRIFADMHSETGGGFPPVPAVAPLAEVRDFGTNPGKLRMLAFVPTKLPPRPALVVALHGCTQTAATYDFGSGWSTLAERHGFVLVMPEQRQANNPNLCFNWFDPAKTGRTGAETLSIGQMIEHAAAEHGIDRTRIFVVGLSAGGAMASNLLASLPDIIAAGAIVAGLPHGAAGNIGEALQTMSRGRQQTAGQWGDLVRASSPIRAGWPRVSIWHGDVDQVVSQANADASVVQWLDVQGLGPQPDTDAVVRGHRRRRWIGADGRIAVEDVRIGGMGHGVPLGAGDGDTCGNVSAYHFDVGLASSTRIAAFFGIAPSPPDETTALPPKPSQPTNASAGGPGRGAQGRASPAAKPGAIDPQAIITDALQKAGMAGPGAPPVVVETLKKLGLLKP